MRKILVVLVLYIAGFGLLYVGYVTSPSINDKSITFSEFRSRSKLSGIPTTFGLVVVAVAVMGTMPARWIGHRRRRHRLNPPPGTDDNTDGGGVSKM